MLELRAHIRMSTVIIKHCHRFSLTRRTEGVTLTIKTLDFELEKVDAIKTARKEHCKGVYEVCRWWVIAEEGSQVEQIDHTRNKEHKSELGSYSSVGPPKRCH